MPFDNSVFAEIKSRYSCRDYAEQFLTHRGGSFYNCPCCGSGTHENRSAAMSIYADGQRWHCHSCGEGGDLFDLIGASQGITGKSDQLRAAAGLAGYDLPDGKDTHAANRLLTNRPATPQPRPPKPKSDYTEGRRQEEEHIKRCQTAIDDPRALAYLESRGISRQLAHDWGLGYDKERRRIVIPWPGCPHYHIDRDVTGTSRAKYLKPDTKKVGPEPLYNAAALQGVGTVFLVEGALDALAVRDLGFEAVALNKSGAGHTADRIIAEDPKARLVALLDNDPAKPDGSRPGQQGQDELVRRLANAGIPCATPDILQRLAVNDPFEAWQRDPAAFRIALASAAATSSIEYRTHALTKTRPSRREPSPAPTVEDDLARAARSSRAVRTNVPTHVRNTAK